jgi:hypothetical protein
LEGPWFRAVPAHAWKELWFVLQLSHGKWMRFMERNQTESKQPQKLEGFADSLGGCCCVLNYSSLSCSLDIRTCPES